MNELINKDLTLVCQNHPTEVIKVTTAEDIYTKSPHGGCSKLCQFIFPFCGHRCPRSCHNYDKDHSNAKCEDFSCK